jgi:hypothetical protein
VGISDRWSRESIAWAAGLFEGEGTIWCKEGYKPALKLQMTDGDVVRKFREIVGYGSCRGPIQPKILKHKPVYIWDCSGSERVQALLAAFWTHLGERRRKKAEETIIFMAGLKGKSIFNCPQGHPYDEENTYRTYRGERMCRACRNQRSKEFRAREARGRTGLPKLTEEQAKQILLSGESLMALSKKYGVSFVTVSDIKRRKTWRHIDVPIELHKPARSRQKCAA